jgi:NitT/TauT family transport system substrate-binding protein
VVREEVYQRKHALLQRFARAYRDAAAWMIAHPEEAAQLATKRAIDGTDPALNLEIIRIRNASSVSDFTRHHGLGAIDIASLQHAADTYQKLGFVQKHIDVAKVVAQDIVPTRAGAAG